MDKPETKANEEWTSQRQRQMKNGQTRDKGKCGMDKPETKQMKNEQVRDKGKCGMDKPETKANEEWTSQRQRQMKNGQARDKGK